MVRSLATGMRTRSCNVCVAALTLFCLEMPDAMISVLPLLLSDLTKISATVHSSQPVLEFISSELSKAKIVSFSVLYYLTLCLSSKIHWFSPNVHYNKQRNLRTICGPQTS